jgi:hypothetical protein
VKADMQFLFQGSFFFFTDNYYNTAPLKDMNMNSVKP